MALKTIVYRTTEISDETLKDIIGTTARFVSSTSTDTVSVEINDTEYDDIEATLDEEMIRRGFFRITP